MDDLINRIREVFKVGRIVRIDGTVRRLRASRRQTVGVLVEVEGGNAEAGQGHLHAHRRHAAAGRSRKEELDPAAVDKEREILSEAARKEGKPENIIGKMVEGRLRTSTPSACCSSSRS